jgi:hypothetical protein
MFKWLSRSARSQRAERPTSRDPVADALLSVDSLGRLSEDQLEGGPAPEAPSEYIAEATEPSEEAWEHEREARRAQEPGESGS